MKQAAQRGARGLDGGSSDAECSASTKITGKKTRRRVNSPPMGRKRRTDNFSADLRRQGNRSEPRGEGRGKRGGEEGGRVSADDACKIHPSEKGGNTAKAL